MFSLFSRGTQVFNVSQPWCVSREAFTLHSLCVGTTLLSGVPCLHNLHTNSSSTPAIQLCYPIHQFLWGEVVRTHWFQRATAPSSDNEGLLPSVSQSPLSADCCSIRSSMERFFFMGGKPSLFSPSRILTGDRGSNPSFAAYVKNLGKIDQLTSLWRL